MTTDTMDSLLRLPKKRKMEIAERLWLSAADERTVRVPAAHKKIVASRLADYQAGKSIPLPLVTHHSPLITGFTPISHLPRIANRPANRIVSPMSTVVEIESAVEKLSPQEAREFAVWYEQRQALLTAADAIFSAYDKEEEEKAP